MSQEKTKTTSLFLEHQKAGARMMEFAGWQVPVQYSNLRAEHEAVRSAAGIFDVSHMGEIACRGPKAFDFLQNACSNDLAKLADGKAQYSLLLNQEGGVVDDIIVYRISEGNYFLCVNAANAEKDFAWLENLNKEGAELLNISSDWAQVAVQGPHSEKILSSVIPEIDSYSKTDFPFFSFQQIKSDNLGETIVARTGYTGEDGFEIFLAPTLAPELWAKLLSCGATPIGFGARDTLRLEAALPLHGHELREDLPALTSNVAWAIKFNKGDFSGRDSLINIRQNGPEIKLTGLEVMGKGLIRENMKLKDESGEEIGWVSSGTQTPTVGKSIGLGFLPTSLASPGNTVMADIRGRLVEVQTCSIPFYRRRK